MRKFYDTLLLAVSVIAVGCSCSKAAEGGEDGLSIKADITEKFVTNDEGSFEVHITSNTSWTAVPQADWLSASPVIGEGNKTVTISYESNYTEGSATSGPDREGAVMFKAEGADPLKIIVKQTRTFKNPIFQPLPDPYAWRQDTGSEVTYYLCKASGNSVNLGKSNKMTEPGGTKGVWSLPTTAGAWNSANLWAPELHYIDNAWYVYYAAGWKSSDSKNDPYFDSDYGSQRTGVIRCQTSDPTTGTWEDMGQIFTSGEDNLEKYLASGKVDTKENDYAIDMTVFKLDDQLYAVWSGQPNQKDGSQRLYIAKMENPWTIKSARVEISRAELPYEKVNSTINEGPAMLFNPDKTKLFCVYSCNGSWTPEYKLGWLELDLTDPAKSDPLNPDNWKKSTSYVFWRNDNSPSENDHPDKSNSGLQKEEYMHIGGVNGLGHNTFLKSPDGTEDWIMYHVKRFKENGWSYRDCFIQKFTWDENGRPVFGTPVGWQEELPVPSGEPL